MSERLDRIEKILEGLATQQQNNTDSIERLTDALYSYVESSQVERARYQSDFMAVERRLDQHLEEIERLWRYLFAQLENRGNGNGGEEV